MGHHPLLPLGAAPLTGACDRVAPVEPRQAARTRRSQTDSLDLLIRGTLYSMLFFELFLVGQLVFGGSAAHVAAGVLLGAVHAATCAVVLRSALGAMLHGEALDRRLVVVLAVLGVAVVVGLGVLGGGDEPRGPVGLALMIVASFSLFALSPVVDSRRLAVACLVVTAVTLTVVLPGDGTWEDAGSALPAVLLALLWPLFLVVVAGRMTCWMLSLVWQIDAARTTQAQLAVAEERLRFSRDLHDVVGRTLSVVAVKSELAAELARRGLDGAAEQMLEVRQIAQDSLREVRSLAVGYRTADLDAELAGARSLLRSAGIDARTTLAAEPSGTAEREVLAWVVREATTNVVRHSDARWCTLAITRAGDGSPVVLTISNDGVGRGAPVSDDVEVRGTTGGGAAPVRATRPSVGGTGLVGLRERCAAVGGTLTTETSGETFTVVATVPDTGTSEGSAFDTRLDGSTAPDPTDPASTAPDPTATNPTDGDAHRA